MVTLTLAVPEELKDKMDHFPELNWSEIARQAFKEKIEDLEFLKKFKSRSELTEKDALELGAKVSKALSKRLKEKVKN